MHNIDRTLGLELPTLNPAFYEYAALIMPDNDYVALQLYINITCFAGRLNLSVGFCYTEPVSIVLETQYS